MSWSLLSHSWIGPWACGRSDWGWDWSCCGRGDCSAITRWLSANGIIIISVDLFGVSRDVQWLSMPGVKLEACRPNPDHNSYLCGLQLELSSTNEKQPFVNFFNSSLMGRLINRFCYNQLFLDQSWSKNMIFMWPEIKMSLTSWPGLTVERSANRNLWSHISTTGWMWTIYSRF